MTFNRKLEKDGKALSMTWVVTLSLYLYRSATPCGTISYQWALENTTAVCLWRRLRKRKGQKERTKSKAIKRQGIMFARGEIFFFLPLISSKQHICSEQRRSNAPSEETQSEMFRLLWQRVCLHLLAAQTKLFFHLTGDEENAVLQTPQGICALWRSQLLAPMCENIMFCGKRFWYYTSGEGWVKPMVWTDCQTGLWTKKKTIQKTIYTHTHTQVNCIKDVLNNEDRLWHFVTFAFT